MAFQPYTPTTNVWWDLVNTPLYLPQAGDPYTYDNQILSTVATNPSGYTQQGFEGKVLDNLAYLKTKLLPASGAFTRGSSGTGLWNSTNWSGTQTQAGQYSNSSNAATSYLWLPLDSSSLPNGVTLNAVSLVIAGSTTDAALPASMPTISIWQVPTGGGSPTQIGSTTTDATAALATYKANHTLTVSATTTIDRSQYTYWLRVSPEYGANSNPAMLTYQPSVTWTANGSLLY